MRKSSPDSKPLDEKAGEHPAVAPDNEPEEKSRLGGPPSRIELNGRKLTLLRVFEPAKARARFAALQGCDPPRPDDVNFAEGPERLLARMAHDHIAGMRPLSVADQHIIEGLVALRAEMPNFEAFLLDLEISARASMMAQVPLTIPPTILLGVPGTGKTRICRRLSEILRVKYERISMPSLSGGHPISGTDATWRSSRAGIVAEALVNGATANPLICLDEIDKCATQHNAEHPLDVFHDLWEREGATNFHDDCLKLRFDASAIYWICAANDLNDIRPSLLDRTQVFEIEKPSREEMEAIITVAYREACMRWRDWFDPTLGPSIIDRLRSAHPRLVHRLFQLAMNLAAAHGRHELSLDDISTAMESYRCDEKPRIGFR